MTDKFVEYLIPHQHHDDEYYGDGKEEDSPSRDGDDDYNSAENEKNLINYDSQIQQLTIHSFWARFLRTQTLMERHFWAVQWSFSIMTTVLFTMSA